MSWYLIQQGCSQREVNDSFLCSVDGKFSRIPKELPIRILSDGISVFVFCFSLGEQLLRIRIYPLAEGRIRYRFWRGLVGRSLDTP